jgi:hypothetical protein
MWSAHELTLSSTPPARLDSFALALGASNWPATLSATTTGLLAPGAESCGSGAGRDPGRRGLVRQRRCPGTATGVGDPAFSATVSCHHPGRRASLDLSVAPTALSSTQEVGQVVDQALLISNGNGVTLTVAISDIDLTPGRAPSPQYPERHSLHHHRGQRGQRAQRQPGRRHGHGYMCLLLATPRSNSTFSSIARRRPQATCSRARSQTRTGRPQPIRCD